MAAAVVDALFGCLLLATIPAPGFLAGLVAGRLAASTTAHHAFRTPSGRETGARVAACLMCAAATETMIWRFSDDKRGHEPAFPRLKNGPTRERALRLIGMCSLAAVWGAAGSVGYRVAMKRWAPMEKA
jgi:hypothetical protein